MNGNKQEHLRILAERKRQIEEEYLRELADLECNDGCANDEVMVEEENKQQEQEEISQGYFDEELVIPDENQIIVGNQENVVEYENQQENQQEEQQEEQKQEVIEEKKINPLMKNKIVRLENLEDKLVVYEKFIESVNEDIINNYYKKDKNSVWLCVDNERVKIPVTLLKNINNNMQSVILYKHDKNYDDGTFIKITNALSSRNYKDILSSGINHLIMNELLKESSIYQPNLKQCRFAFNHYDFAYLYCITHGKNLVTTFHIIIEKDENTFHHLYKDHTDKMFGIMVKLRFQNKSIDSNKQHSIVESPKKTTVLEKLSSGIKSKNVQVIQSKSNLNKQNGGFLSKSNFPKRRN